MTSSRKTAVIAAALALTFIGGVALAPLLVTPAAAQLIGGTASRIVETTFGAHLGGKNVLTVAATYIGITEEALRTELQAGKSLAEIAVANGKTRDGLVAALKDAAAEQIQTLVDQKGPFQRPGPGFGPGFGHAIQADIVATAADYLGITVGDLRQKIADGDTLGEIANATAGKSRDGLIAALVDEAEANIDQAQTNGRITAEQAARMKENLEEHMTRVVDAEGFPFRVAFPGRRGR